ncbi:MAG: hypothetical protein GY856_18410, partial [bacterium]|nr:hypothetical protein [bacterium]
MVVLLVVLTVIVFMVIEYFVLRARRPVAAESSTAPAAREVLDAGKAPDEIPPGVFVGPGHAWLHLEHSGEAAIG